MFRFLPFDSCISLFIQWNQSALALSGGSLVFEICAFGGFCLYFWNVGRTVLYRLLDVALVQVLVMMTTVVVVVVAMVVVIAILWQ